MLGHFVKCSKAVQILHVNFALVELWKCKPMITKRAILVLSHRAMLPVLNVCCSLGDPSEWTLFDTLLKVVKLIFCPLACEGNMPHGDQTKLMSQINFFLPCHWSDKQVSAHSHLLYQKAEKWRRNISSTTLNPFLTRAMLIWIYCWKMRTYKKLATSLIQHWSISNYYLS